jgi:hypothetical protein
VPDAAPATDETEPGTAFELHHHRGRRIAGVPAPRRVEGLALHSHRLASDQVTGQIELVNGHVDQERIVHLLPEASEVITSEQLTVDQPDGPDAADQLPDGSELTEVAPRLRHHQQSPVPFGGGDHGEGAAHRLGHRLLTQHG